MRTRFVGHLRDVRRLVVAMSRARLGLYVFCRRSIFEQCYELQPTFQLLLKRPDRLALNMNEITSYTERNAADPGPSHHVHLVSGIEEMASIVDRLYQVCLNLVILDIIFIYNKAVFICFYWFDLYLLFFALSYPNFFPLWLQSPLLLIKLL